MSDELTGENQVPKCNSSVHHSSFTTHHSVPWSIGLIAGPSGSGKSTIARAIFGDRVYRPRDWATDRAVIDGLGQRPIKEITRLFTAVGFSSPPSWIKPYQVLSGGEQFRCDLARALAGDEGGRRRAEGGEDSQQRAIGEDSKSVVPPSALRLPPLVVFDEFTSVVDRNVARVVVGGRGQGHPRGSNRLPLRGRDLPLRRDRVARARLGHRHGHGHLFAEASSATADPA